MSLIPPPDQPEPDADATIMVPRPGRRAGAVPAAAAAPAPGLLDDGGDSDATLMAPRGVPGAGASRTSTQPFDVDATLAVPAGRPNAAAQSPAGQSVAVGARNTGANRLLAAANPVLDLVPVIQSTLNHDHPIGLRDQLQRAILQFEADGRAAGYSAETLSMVRYALCAVVDEAVATTPWGMSSGWSQSPLLLNLHSETYGGEKFFQLLNHATASPAQHLDMLEFFHACLCLGFQGRYRVQDNGRPQLEQVRTKVFHLIRQQRGEYERDLSGRWRGEARPPLSLVRRIPWWAFATAGTGVLTVIYLTCLILLNQSSDPVFSMLARVKAPPVKIDRQVAVLTKPRLRTLLASDIAAGALDLSEDASSSRIIVQSDQLFEAGSATPNPVMSAVFGHIAAALNQVPGTVIISGHTDDRPIRSLRFPSNFQLSVERATSVRDLMAAQIQPAGRLQVEGRSDSEPLVANDTPANRARNRRVEILLRAAS